METHVPVDEHGVLSFPGADKIKLGSERCLIGLVDE